MISIHVTTNDLVNMRFAYRPLLEIPLSFRVLRNPEYQAPYWRWIDEVSCALYDLELPYLSALVPAYGGIPDFLTPVSVGHRTDIEAEFEELLNIPDEVVREGIFSLIETHGDSEIRRYFLVHPRAALTCLVEELRNYWQRTLKPYWSRMTATLEGDILYRARQLALGGYKAMFSDLRPTIDYCMLTDEGGRASTAYHSYRAQNNQATTPNAAHQKSVIQVKAACQQEAEFVLNGGGMQLVPTIFRCCGPGYWFAEGWQALLSYGARGTGLWYQRAPLPTQSLELALGAGKASILRILHTPTSNSEVAFRAQIAAATANQHLMRLAQMGLVRSNRSGKRVYYSLTERGENLLELFDAVD
jgi:predicted transcriptional regulator